MKMDRGAGLLRILSFMVSFGG